MRNWLEREKKQLDRTTTRFTQHAKRPAIEHVELRAPEQLAGQFNLEDWWKVLVAFPEPAQERILSVLSIVKGEVPTYFHRQSTAEEPTATANPSEALSGTHIVPSSYWRIPGKTRLEYGITVFRLPEHFADWRVGYFIHLDGITHELAHVLVGATWSNSSVDLQLPSGERTTGDSMIREFATLLQEHNLPPLTHYSANYWKQANELIPPPGDDALMPKGLDEELAVTIAAWILKFCHCEPYWITTHAGRQRIALPGGSGRGFYPFTGRHNIDAWTERFLYARWVPRMH